MYWPDKDRFNYFFSSPILLNSPVDLGSSGFSNSHQFDLITEYRLLSRLSLGFGLGYSSHNLHTEMAISTSAQGEELFELIPDSVAYSSNKLNLKYIDLPIELRLRFPTSDSRFVRAYFGFRLGYRIDSYARLTTDQRRVAFSRLDSVNPWLASVSMRLGYGMFGLYASYGLTPIFRSGALLETQSLEPIRMLQLGISISG